MPITPDILPVVPNQSDVSLNNLLIPENNPSGADVPSTYKPVNDQQWWNNFVEQPSTLSTKIAPQTFDWQKSMADRYVNSNHYKQLGFDPYLGTENVQGKPYEANELRYGQLQTWGDVMGNAVGGAFHLAVGSFEQSVESWGHTANALFTWGSGGGWKAGKEALLGTPEELLANNKKQEDIMNKYAIYHTPYGDSHLFSKEFIGDVTQQMGFGIGMGAEILGETLLTAGIGEAASIFSKGAQAARGIEAGELAARTATETAPLIGTTAEHINDLRKVNDIAGDRELMTRIWQGAKNLIPGAQAASDVTTVYKAGAVGWDLFKAGVPGVIKTFSMANAAKAESMMEASNTYGQMYGDLIAKYQAQNEGNTPTGEALERIKQSAYGAATDNFIVNTGLLMTMNQLEFGNMFNKFGSARRLLREAGEDAKDIFTVANKGKRVAYQKATGPLAMFRNANEVRKDFGMGTALWYLGKRELGSQAAKFEVLEGLQEVLQNSSDQTFRDYYTNLYDGGKDITGRSFWSDISQADFGKGIASQNLIPDSEEGRRKVWENSGGWKTFLMGAVTGMFMSPLSNAAMYANKKGYSLINKEYRSKLEENKALQAQNRDLLNSFYQSPSKMLDEHIANIKVQGEGAKSMASAAAASDKYTFTNSQQDMFTKTVATAIKTGNYDSFIDHINEFAGKLQTNEEFEQAFPQLKSTDATPTDMRSYLHQLTDDITQYHNNWQRLQDEYGSLVQPEIWKGDNRKSALIQKAALNNAIETLATTDWQATQAIRRMSDIKESMGALPGIGTSVSNAYDTLGSRQETAIQIHLLTEQIATYDQLGKDPALKDMKANAREQLKHLIGWQAAHVEQGTIEDKQKAFNGYVQAKNRELNNNTPQVTDNRVLDKAFHNLGDYMNLNQDHQQYIDALNVISHLDNFRKMVDRYVDGIHYFERMATAQMYKEFRERANVTTGTTDEDTPPPDDTTTDLPADPHKDLLAHYTGDEIIPPTGPLAAYLAKFPALKRELDILESQREHMTDILYTQHLNEILDKHFEQKDTDVDTDTPPPVEGPRLKIPHSQVTIAPHRIGDETNEQAAERVSGILAQSSAIEDGLSLHVTINDTIAPNRSDTGNPAIISQGQEYSMQLSLYGQPIGYLTNAGYYRFKVGDQEYTTAQLNNDPKSPLYIGHFVEIPDNKTSYEVLNQFQEDARTADTIQKVIERRLYDTPLSLYDRDLRIAGAELAEILTIIPRIQIDWVETGEQAPIVSELGSHIYHNEQGQIVVADNRLDSEGNITMIQGTLADLDNLHAIPQTGNMGTYSMAIQVAGDTRWIQLTPTVYTREQLQPQLNTLNDLLKDPTDENTRTIKDIIQGIFIQQPVYKRVNGKKDIVEDKKWDIRLQYVEPSPDHKGHLVVTVNKKDFIPRTLENRDISTPEHLAQAVQTILRQKNTFPGIEVTADNFRHQIPLNAGQATTKAILGMTSSVHTNIAKSVSLVYGLPKDKSDLAEEVNTGANSMVTPLPDYMKQHRTDAEKVAVEDSDFSALRAARKKGPDRKVTQVFDQQSIEHIDRFRDWVQSNLPEAISVEDMGVLRDNLLRDSMTVGQFITSMNGLRGHIQVYKNSPFKYHEAFHSVYRMLLSDSQQDNLLRIAKNEVIYNIGTRYLPQKLQEFRDLHLDYQDMTPKELEDTYHIEYMADKFDKWMMDKKVPTSHVIKGFFARIVDWIKALWSKLTNSSMEGLFHDINAGKYQRAGLAVNRFSGIASEDINPDRKVIKIGTQDIVHNGKTITIDRYINQQTAEQVVSGIVNLFYKAVGDSGEYNKGQELNRIIKIYRDTYDTSLPIYKSRARAITDPLEKARYMNELLDMEDMLTDKDSLNSLREAVDFHLNLMGYKQDIDDRDMEAVEDEYGPANIDNAHKKTSAMSDYRSLSKFLRGYIGSTSYELPSDPFGNKELAGGYPIYGNVSANKVYNGLLKVLSNHSDEDKLLDRLLEYRKHEGNPETVKFINRLLDETGFNEDTKEPTKNSQLLMQVIKGFNQYDTPYLFTQVGANNRYKVTYANTRDAARNQFTAWRDANMQLRKVSSKALGDLIDHISIGGGDIKAIGDKVLEKEAGRISQQLLKQTGIQLSPIYVKYLIVAGKDIRTDAQQHFYDLYSSAEAIGPKEFSAQLLEPLKQGVNIFNKTEQVQGKVSTSTPEVMLIRLATGNALFDESVNTMSFTNAEGETIHAHGYPNYDFMAVSDLNDPQVIDRLQRDPARASFLLSDPNFQVLLDRHSLRVEQIDGMRKEGTEGVSYGSFNSREMLANLFGLYDIRQQPDTKVTDGDNIFYKVPVATRVIEAKDSIHMVRLPIIKTITGGQLSQKALDILYDLIQQEYTRIGRVQQEITSGSGNIQGYHTEDKGKPPRGLHFFTTAYMLGDKAADLETLALTGIDIGAHRKEIDQQLQSYWKGQVHDTIALMVQEGLIIPDGKGGYKNLLAPDYLFGGMGDAINSKVNISKQDFTHNIAQVILNDTINTLGINQLLFGDEAKSFSDPIDQVKRMAGANAQGPSMAIPFTHKDWGIEHTLDKIHHITYRTGKVLSGTGSGNLIDSDDGQMYMTEKGLRYMLFGFGKLNQVQVDILDKLSTGGQVTAKEFFDNGGLKDRGPFNSYKLVYFDGQTYLKCSTIPLFRNLPVYAEEAHILRMKMEDFEDRNNTVVFAHPVSVSKAMKENIAGSIYDVEDRHFNQLEAKYMRQQLENPSNKLIITDPSQAKQQIMSEQVDSTPVVFMGVPTTIGVVKAAYMADVSQKITNNYSSAVNSIFNLQDALIELDNSRNLGQVTPRMGVFLDHMRQTLQTTGADQQTLGFMATENGEPVYNLNFPSTLEKFTSAFLNYFSRGIVAEKTPGVTLALVSGGLGMGMRYKEVISLDDNGQPKQWRVVTDREYRKNPGKYQDAHRWSDSRARTFDGLQIGDYILDDLRHNVAEYDSQGNITGRFSEYIRPAHYREEMTGIPDALQKGFGIRIPSDDKHSYISLRMVDTMPVQYGSVGIFPHELIEISGADFDIDKLFIQLADTYISGDNRVAYGDVTDPKEQFEEYILWQAENNKVIKDAVRGIEDTGEGKIAKLLGDDRQILIAALRDNKMPYTVDIFIKAGGADKLNNGVLNNRILAQRLVMQSNSHIAGEIADTPTTTQPLIDLADSLYDELYAIDPTLPTLKVLREDVGNVNTIHGKVLAYAANKEGARNIGATANAIQVYSLLNNGHIQLSDNYHITIDGHIYTGFNRTTGTDGVRIFSTLSTLLNAMTDNAKERLASRLGLNITALGYVSNMVSLGIPLRTSVLLMLQPAVRRYFSEVQKLSGGLRTQEEQNTGKKRLLQNMIGDNVSPDWTLDTQGLLDNIANHDEGADLTALSYLQKIDDISSTLMKISQVQKLSQGLPTTWEDVQRLDNGLQELGIAYSNGQYTSIADKDFDDLSLPVDVRDTLLHDQRIIATNLKVMAQVQELSKKVFLEKTPLFQRVCSIATDNMRFLYPAEREEFGKQLKFDTVSYLSTNAYIHWLQQQGQGSTLVSLNNAMIYPSARDNNTPGYEDIVDIMNRLKETLIDSNENYLVSRFLQVTTAQNNRNGINTIEANTWARINELQQDRLVTAFTLLYSNSYKDTAGNIIDTHNDAQALFNYLIVKDGGQFKSGSFIRFIPNYMFRDIMDRTTEVNNFLSSGVWDEQKAQALFGVPSEQLLHDFMISYSTHIGNTDYLRKVTIRGAINAHPVTRNQGQITVDMYRDTVYSKDPNDQQKAQLSRNTDYIKASGFLIEEGKVVLPYSINVEGTLYVLSNTGKQSGNKVTELIAKGETIARATAATYTQAEYQGAKSTFKSSIGLFPGTQQPEKVTTTPKQQVYDDIDQQGDFIQQYEQGELPEQTPIDRLSAQGISLSAEGIHKIATTADGRRFIIPTGTKLDDIPAIISGQSVVPSQQMSRNHTMSYKMAASENLTGKDTSTVELAEQGIRTATTRSYPLGKVGDIITFEGRSQQYRITGTEQLTADKVGDPNWIRDWSQKEQWTVDYFRKVLGGSTVHIGSWQTSFQKIGQQDLFSQPQQMTSDQWRSELTTLYGNNREKIQQAIALRDSLRSKVSDEDILNKIKECI